MRACWVPFCVVVVVVVPIPIIIEDFIWIGTVNINSLTSNISSLSQG
jgi:hypothetical protein